MSLILTLIIGGVVGWLASQIMVKGALGGLNDILAGVAGAVLGGWIFPAILPAFLANAFQQAPLLGHIVFSAMGAVISTFATRAYMGYQKKA